MKFLFKTTLPFLYLNICCCQTIDLRNLTYCAHDGHLELDTIYELKIGNSLKEEDPEIWRIFERIVKVADQSTSFFELRKNESRGRALAFNYQQKRFIVYDPKYYEDLFSGETEWRKEIAHYLVLGHEVAHQVHGHAFDGHRQNTRSNLHNLELIADWKAGWYLAKINPNINIRRLEDILSKILTRGYGRLGELHETSKYPCKKERVMHMIAGYLEGVTETWSLDEQDAGGYWYKTGRIGSDYYLAIDYPEGMYIGEYEEEYIRAVSKSPSRMISKGFGILNFGKSRANPWDEKFDKYIGYWDNRRSRNGWGTIHYRHIEKVARQFGLWKGGSRPDDANGNLYYMDGTFYKGGINGKRRDGIGTQFSPDGSQLYEGNFKLDRYHGKGELYNKHCPCVFDGQFANGKKIESSGVYKRNGKILREHHCIPK